MDADPNEVDRALADLTELSSQIEAAAVLSADGEPLATTLSEGPGAVFARAALDLLRDAGEDAIGVEAATPAGSVFAVRDGTHVLAATASRGAPSGLVLYDLRACLQRLAEQPKKRAARKKKQPYAAS